MPTQPLVKSTHGKIRTFTVHVLSVTTPAKWSTWAQALSTRFELAIFSVTGRRELQASPREHSVGDDRIELPSSRCKRDVIPFHQSPAAMRRAAVQGFEPRLTRSERVVRPAHSTATNPSVGDRGVDPRLAASKAAVQGRYTNPQCAMRELNSHRLVGGQKSCR